MGTNLLKSTHFDCRYNSSNIDQISGQSFDLLVCSAAPATMWLANNDPDADLANLMAIIQKIRSATVGRLVLISTIAVFEDASSPVDEASDAFEGTLAYGRNRRTLETEMLQAFENVLIVRLPALFGLGLKKNFIFDILNPVPSFLKPDLFESLKANLDGTLEALVESAFSFDATVGMWKFDRGNYGRGPEEARLREVFRATRTTALAFTNPESCFQFYHLANLWNDIQRALDAGLSVLNVASAPIVAHKVYSAVTGQRMPESSAPVVSQDIRSRHADLWGRQDGYLYGRDDVLSTIVRFCETYEASY